MLVPPAPYQLRPMMLDDLTAVYAIDALSFPRPSRPGLFENEIVSNSMAHYQVLLAHETVIGFAGYWLIGDEAHVSSIAVHPHHRGQQLGELLLLNLLFLAYKQQASLVTLEVRVSNLTAQNLYKKYQFEVVGKRVRYYRDNNEDALIMTVPVLDSQHYHFLQQQEALLLAQLGSEDPRP